MKQGGHGWQYWQGWQWWREVEDRSHDLPVDFKWLSGLAHLVHNLLQGEGDDDDDADDDEDDYNDL